MDEIIDQLKNGEPKTWLLVFAIYCAILGCYSLYYCLRMRRWPSVAGSLTQKDIAVWNPAAVTSEQDYFLKFSYNYKVGGTEYIGHRVSPFFVLASFNLRFFLRLQIKKIEIGENGQVRVFYDPRHPEKSYLLLPSASGYIALLGVIFIPLVLYFMV